MRFPARTAALLAALIALVASTLAATSAVPAQAASRSVLHLPKAPAGGDAYGDVVGDATMWAREAVLHPEKLSVSARRQASTLGSRPDYTAAGETSSSECSSVVPICVHWATSGVDKPAAADWQDTVLATLTHVYQTYQAAGYRMPEPDGTRGGNGDIDIYLANIGGAGYYGYCAPDPNPGSTTRDTPAFCVLDNDYAEFRNGTALTNLQVTAAHEFFHAVQFAYDATEDPWFMESTAVWIEDEVYTDINDNVQYLRYGPLGKPAQSLDKNTTYGVYGGWIFFRWVTEHRPDAQSTLPTIIRSMWERAAANGSNRYSLQAVKGALKAAGLPLRTAFAKFAAANRDPAHTYSEGAANHYPVAKPAKKYKVRSTRRTTGTVRIDHLAAATERFVPKGHQLKNKHTKLRLSVDMADKKRGTDAVVTVFLRGGGTQLKTVKLSKSGKGAVTVPFSTRTVKRVELTMTNASTRMTCWVGGSYSCQGQPKDMNQLERFSVRAKH